MKTLSLGKPDGNQRDIVEALRKIGAVVRVVSGTADAGFDLVVGYRGRVFLAEVKKPQKTLTPAERAVHDQFATVGVAVYVWYTPEQAIDDLTNP